MNFDLALIPARGGSVGLPGKNILPLGGIPLIGWTIRAALRSGIFAQVVVSTDSDEIARIAQEYGAAVPFLRPSELATSKTSSNEVIDHALKVLQVEDNFALLQPTSPFRSAAHLREAAKLYASSGADGVMAIVAAKPLGWHIKISDHQRLIEAFSEEPPTLRRQDSTQYFVPNGSIYMTDARSFQRLGSLPKENLVGYRMGTIDSLDIDDADDFKLAAALVNADLRKIDP